VRRCGKSTLLTQLMTRNNLAPDDWAHGGEGRQAIPNLDPRAPEERREASRVRRR